MGAEARRVIEERNMKAQWRTSVRFLPDRMLLRLP